VETTAINAGLNVRLFTDPEMAMQFFFDDETTGKADPGEG
jgi:hypothetical protein